MSQFNLPDIRNLVARIHPDFKPVWDGLSEKAQLGLTAYFLPRNSGKGLLKPKSRLIAWYCPQACQRRFPSGHRYCLNVYSGCAFGCEYCYAKGYSRADAACKDDFARRLKRDLADLDAFDVPPAPIHLSNSTDPFQPLERIHGHARLGLEGILEHRHRFSTVTLLTKNPLLPVQGGYLDLFKALGRLPADHPRQAEFAANGHPPFQVQVSMAFWRDEARAAYDPCAPSVEDRQKGILALREAGIPVVLRIDPLFPRSPLPIQPSATLKDFGLEEAQTLDDLESLVAFARKVGVRHVVYSTAKIVQPRGRPLSPTMAAMRDVYRAICLAKQPIWRDFSWRLPPEVFEPHVVRPFLKICERQKVATKFCMRDLVEIP